VFWVDSGAVIGDDANDLDLAVEFHELGGFCAVLIGVNQHDAGEAMEYIEQFEVEAGIRLEAAQEAGSQCVDAGDASGSSPRSRAATGEVSSTPGA